MRYLLLVFPVVVEYANRFVHSTKEPAQFIALNTLLYAFLIYLVSSFSQFRIKDLLTLVIILLGGSIVLEVYMSMIAINGYNEFDFLRNMKFTFQYFIIYFGVSIVGVFLAKVIKMNLPTKKQ